MIAIGVAILLYPIVGNWIAEQRRNQSVAEYQHEMERVSDELIAYHLEKATLYNEFIYNRQQGFPFEYIPYDSLRLQAVQVMGTVCVPALGISSLPFYHGTAYDTLNRGLGHFERSSIPIGGEDTRGVITGHSGVHNQLLFTEINRLKEGDVFFVNILGRRLAYEIESFEEILPTDVHRVDVVPGRDMVTLLTCTPPGINTYRLLVNGFRIPYEEAVAREVVVRNQWSYERIVLGSLALIVFLFVVSYLRYRWLRKRTLSEDAVVAAKSVKKLRRLIKGVKIMFALLLIGTIAVLGFAIYGFIRMQEQPSLGQMNIGVHGEAREQNLFRIMHANYEERQIASVNIANYSEAVSLTWDTVNDWGIGKIIMPESGIELPILAGIENINLLTGGATYCINQRLGRGNYVLLAHSVYGNQTVLFQPLYFTRIGEYIFATDFENVYTYQVFLNRVVLDTEVHFIEDIEEGETPIITLLRCEGGIGTRYRRVVQGELVNVELLNAETLADFNLVKEDSELLMEEGGSPGGGLALLSRDPISNFQRFTMSIAAQMLSDPVQVALPLFLLLVFPIIFLSILPAQNKKEKRRRDIKRASESDISIVFDMG